MADKQRLDVYMVKNGIVSGREIANECILQGTVLVNGKTVTKASFAVDDTDTVDFVGESLAYVSRGGLKLEKALAVSALSVAGYTALDIGASTGGFTHCLLQHGAEKVFALDVGHDQLHPLLRCDPRVINLEGTDIRSDRAKTEIPLGGVDIITADVSFISLRSVLPYALPFLKRNGWLVVLIKPQFEAGRTAVGKNGIVRDRAIHIKILREMLDLFSSLQCSPTVLTGSPIRGGAGRQQGNVEYLAVLRYPAQEPFPLWDCRRIVEETFTIQ